MAYTVLRTRAAGRVVEAMTKAQRRKYEAARDALRGEGCKAGGKRLLATDNADYALCQRSLYGDWRMTLAFLADGTIVVVQIARHTERETPNALLAELFPGLSASGRRRSSQPPCCEDAAHPPLSAEVDRVLSDVFGL